MPPESGLGAPHEVRGMSDDLTVMGIAQRESRLFSRIRRSTQLRATRMTLVPSADSYLVY